MVLTKPDEGNINSESSSPASSHLYSGFCSVSCTPFPFSIYTWNTWLCSQVPLTNVISLYSTLCLPGLYHWSLLISYLITHNLEDSPSCQHLTCCRGFYVCKSSNLWSLTTIPIFRCNGNTTAIPHSYMLHMLKLILLDV